MNLRERRGLKQSRLIELYLYNEYNHEMNQNRTRKRFPPFFLSKMKGKEYLLTRQKKMSHSHHDLNIKILYGNELAFMEKADKN